MKEKKNRSLSSFHCFFYIYFHLLLKDFDDHQQDMITENTDQLESTQLNQENDDNEKEEEKEEEMDEFIIDPNN